MGDRQLRGPHFSQLRAVQLLVWSLALSGSIVQ